MKKKVKDMLEEMIFIIRAQYPNFYTNLLKVYKDTKSKLSNEKILAFYAKQVIRNNIKDALIDIVNVDIINYSYDLRIITFKNDEKATKIRIYLRTDQILNLLQEDITGKTLINYINQQKECIKC
ncbi:MAG: hypothetical protein IKO49_01575 [Bacilli bacterium]|nr:hypothetical protein [Clostridia bacterium]MBR4617990.1 hypothetical protein [Bacilli bacterium]